MSRLSFFFTTLIAAVPAAFLAYQCVRAFLFYSDALPAILMAFAGITLLICVAVIAMPAYVLLKTKDRTKPAEASDKPADEESAEEVASGEIATADEEPPAASAEEDVFVEGHADEFDDFDESPRKK